jgi:putative glutamine amidotransferase
VTSAPTRLAGAPEAGAPLRVGISACVFHADPARPVFNGKPLYYVEQSMARWVSSQGALAYMIPEPSSADEAARIADDLDALVLAGGVDMSPSSYGESPRKPEWSGDAVRDAYEIGLLREFTAREKPVLGICRGHQVLNVAFGGTLHQDISTDVAGARVHRDPIPYDRLVHEIDIEPGSSLAALYGGITRGTVNSVHHQAVKSVGKAVVVEARSHEDGVVEAIRVEGRGYVRGVQWHPEFAHPTPAGLLDSAPILREFLAATELRRNASRRQA